MCCAQVVPGADYYTVLGVVRCLATSTSTARPHDGAIYLGAIQNVVPTFSPVEGTRFEVWGKQF